MSLLFTDAIGQQHPVWNPEQARIVSLVPSLTELLIDLGLQHALVGRTGFCIHPADQVAAIPKVGGTKDVNIAKIRALAPTHLFVNIDENTKPVVDELATFVPHVVVTHPLKVNDNPALFRLAGGLFGHSAQAEALCTQFESAQQVLADCAARSRPQRVLYCIWQDPWMTVSAQTYIADMCRQIGWQQVVIPDNDQRYPGFKWTSALCAEIDLILLSSEPYRFTQQHVDILERQTGLPVELVDGEMFSWYGSRSIAGLKYITSFCR
ncbi:helical backbone metal receptor [Undibacterium rugosum]|uniref:helical backbone metal receptor n=1 Tax=Undibacterium rugosum TaxID=2762291 RepID=UPI001B8444A4|nr:helical backbone metal receptor [Undibacterium rugosum]MBR7779922.1 ABC transporter substrate-binding protein [Undibacterium rugosum]